MAPARGPDFATLSEAAFKAADDLLHHNDFCHICLVVACAKGRRLQKDYRTKKDKALKAIRGRKK